MDRIFKRTFLMTGAISQDRESCQFRFWLMKNPLLFRLVRPERGRNARGLVHYGAARSNSERAAPSACVGKQFSALRLSGIDRLDELGNVANASRHALHTSA